MVALYEITASHKQLENMVENDELTLDEVKDTMEMLEGDFNDKAISIIAVKENMQGDVSAIDSQIERLQLRKKAIQKRQDSLIEYLRTNMIASDITNIKCPLFSITLAKGRDIVSIDDVARIHTDFLSIKTTTSPMKKEILAALKAGELVHGASLTKSAPSIRIK